MRPGPLFKFFGSKWRLSAHLPPPKHSTIIEPFAGGAAYSLRHATHDHRVILIEQNPNVVAIWKWLQTDARDEAPTMPRHLEAGRDLWSYGWSHGATWWAIYKQRTSFVNSHTVSKWGTGFHSSYYGAAELERAASAHRIIGGWSIIEGDYTQAPGIEATWYIDPPYQSQAANDPRYHCGRPDFAALGEWCRSLPGQTIVSEAEGADWLPFEDFAPSQINGAHTNREKTRAREVLWVNER